MNRKLMLTGLLFITAFIANSQEAQVKENKVLLDGKEILKYEKSNANEQLLYSLNDEEILMFRWNDNETPRYHDNDYFILNFLTAKKKIESNSTTHVIAGLGMNSKKNIEKLVGWPLKQKVLDTEGKINSERLDIFYEK